MPALRTCQPSTNPSPLAATEVCSFAQTPRFARVSLTDKNGEGAWSQALSFLVH
jgi:hypothetical protein